MQIQLKQQEIEAALKMFVSQQGINLTGKTVVVEFTSGRKNNGLSAELTIEDAVTNSTNTSAVPEPQADTSHPQTQAATAQADESEGVVRPISLFNK